MAIDFIYILLTKLFPKEKAKIDSTKRGLAKLFSFWSKIMAGEGTLFALIHNSAQYVDNSVVYFNFYTNVYIIYLVL